MYDTYFDNEVVKTTNNGRDIDHIPWITRRSIYPSKADFTAPPDREMQVIHFE